MQSESHGAVPGGREMFYRLCSLHSDQQGRQSPDQQGRQSRGWSSRCGQALTFQFPVCGSMGRSQEKVPLGLEGKATPHSSSYLPVF